MTEATDNQEKDDPMDADTQDPAEKAAQSLSDEPGSITPSEVPDEADDTAETQPGRKPVRQRLTEAEAEVERLAVLLAATREAQLDRILADVGVDRDLAAVKGVTVEAHLDADTGLVDLDAAREAAEAVRLAATGSRRPKPVGLAGKLNSAAPQADWGTVLSTHMTRPGG